MKITVEPLVPNHGISARVYEVARVPVIGDRLYTDDLGFRVEKVFLALDPGADQPVAIVRVSVYSNQHL